MSSCRSDEALHCSARMRARMSDIEGYSAIWTLFVKTLEKPESEEERRDWP